jgi:hypothetical protein
MGLILQYDAEGAPRGEEGRERSGRNEEQDTSRL